MKKKLLAKGLACLFVLTAFGGCKPQVPEEEITIYMPDGAPALALAKLMYEDVEGDGVTYKVVDSSLIASKVTNKNDDAKNADFCIMPVTAASKLLGTGEKYTMLGTVTHGNLYLLSNTDTKIDQTNLSVLIGKKVGVLQINNVPGLTFKTVLNKRASFFQKLIDKQNTI